MPDAMKDGHSVFVKDMQNRFPPEGVVNWIAINGGGGG
jgi:hypothetical protein